MKKTYLLSCKLLLTLSLFFSFESFSQTVLLTDNVPGNRNFIVPPGTTALTVEVWGAGGHGANRTNNGNGGGGGGGAYSRILIPVVPGTVIPYNVGAGSSTNAAGGDSWFLNTTTVLAKGGNSSPNNSVTGGTGGQASQGFGDVVFSGGNGSTAATGSANNGGGGGSSAGTASNGNNGSGRNGGAAPIGGANGGLAGSIAGSAFGASGGVPGGGGGGAIRTAFDFNGGNGGNGQIRITAPQQYRAEFISMDIGLPTWCAGETRTVSVTIRNMGMATWTNSGPDINIGVKWNGEPDYLVRTDANNLIPGATQTYTLTVTAPAAGTNYLQFDVVNEGNCWFGNNNNSCGPGNTVFQSSTLTIQNCVANGPGGVRTNLQLWLRADLLNGTTSTADNSQVSTWNTQANGSNATVNAIGQQPIYRNTATLNANFNAVVDFTNDNNNAPEDYNYGRLGQQYLQGTSGFYSQDMFVVSIPDENISAATPSMDIFCGNSTGTSNVRDGSGIGYGTYSIRFDNEVISYAIGTTNNSPSTPINDRGFGIAQVSTTASYSTGSVGLINTRNNSSGNGQELFYNANNIGNTIVGLPQFTNVSNSRFWIGRSKAFRSSLDARVAEIITFDSRKNDGVERNRIESYLAIKYGITLGVNGTSQNYVNSDGTVIWNASANAGFNTNIAGIGRNDISRLTQKQSRSSNDVNDVVISLGDIVAATNTANASTFVNDKEFLVWGHNGQNLASSGVNATVSLGGLNTTFTSGNRKYKIVETGGDVGQTVVSIPRNSLATAFPKAANQEYVLIVSSTGNFASTDIVDIIPMRDNGTTLETWYDFDGTKFFSFGTATEQTSRYRLDNQTGDFIVGEKNINLNTSFTVSGWFRTSATNGSIVAKNGAYDFYVNASGRFVANWNGTDRLTSRITVNNNKWHYFAVTFDGSTANLYIDGVQDVSTNSVAPVANTNRFSIGAVWGTKSAVTKVFSGDIDEIRIWNSALNVTQIRYIMNQEIQKNGTVVFGKSIPNTITKNDISSTLWSNLLVYYDMNSFYGTTVKDRSDNNSWARLKYLNNDKTMANSQTAPLPYVSAANGSWQNETTWTNGNLQELPNNLSIVNNSISVDWNIVETSHAISSNGNKTVLGLSVNSNTLSATNDTKIEVSHYLKINGKLDLTGRSQLVQTLDSDFDVTSSGNAERDQQGMSNRFNYNYWSSPVGTINNSTNNNNYTVAGVMKDGTTATPQNINFIGGADGSPTTPISIARRWLYKFQNTTGVYANWAQINENSPLFAGQGFTMKGSGAATSNQNYTFIGKPNNGRITVSIGGGMSNLLGNPYLSGLDATQFITDNLGVMTGTIYFWDHYAGNTHILRQYQGGYAARNLTGGVVAVSTPEIIPGTGTKVPQRYIPVGQGFWIESNATGGNLIFNNNQRGFVKEDDGNSFTMFRNATAPMTEAEHFENNQNDVVEENDGYKKVRLNYFANGVKRDILIGFMDNLASADFDPGYDGYQWDTQATDFYFNHQTGAMVIQGTGTFNVADSFPLTLITQNNAEVKIKLEERLNFDDSQEIYIHDNLTDTYYDIRNEDFAMNLNTGSYPNRFSLRFTNDASLGINPVKNQDIRIAFAYATNILHIKNPKAETMVESVTAFNILGQQVFSQDVKNADQGDIQVPFEGFAAGTYIFKIKTDGGSLSYKVVVK